MGERETRNGLLRAVGHWIGLGLLASTAGCMTGVGSFEAPELLRQGPYVGAGGFFALENFDLGVVEKAAGSSADADHTYGPDVRVGYRFHPNLAAELLFQYYAGSDFEAAGAEVGSFRGWSTTINAKGLQPITDDLHVYAVAGVGLLNGRVRNTAGPTGGTSDTEQDILGRVGVGVDAYLTENLVGYVEASYHHAFDSLDDFDLIPFLVGVQYRF